VERDAGPPGPRSSQRSAFGFPPTCSTLPPCHHARLSSFVPDLFIFPHRSNSMNGSSLGQNTTSLSSSPSAESSSSTSASAAISRSEMPSPCFGTFASPSVPHARLKTNYCYFLPPSSVLSGVKYLHDIVHRDLKYVALPLFSFPSVRSLDLTSGLWIDRRTFSSVQKDPSSDIVIADFGMYVALTCSPERPLTHMGVTRLRLGSSQV
jgi:hypothetical protein